MADNENDGPPEREVKDFHFKEMRKIRVFNSPQKIPTSRTSLLAASSKYGLTFIGCPTGIRIIVTSELGAINLRDEGSMQNVLTNYSSSYVDLKQEVCHVALSADELTLSVCLKTEKACVLDLFDVRTLVSQKEKSESFFSFNLTTEPDISLTDLKWNPSNANMFAVCLSSGSLTIYEVSDAEIKEISGLSSSGEVQAICWSPKGKQIVVGHRNGSLTQYNHEMQIKKEIGYPQCLSLDEPQQVTDILWITATLFAVVYTSFEEGEMPNFVMIATPKTEPEPVTTNFEDIYYGMNEERKNCFFMSLIRDWNILTSVSANAFEVAVLAKQEGDKGMWEKWAFDDTGRATMPLTYDNDETLPMGMAIDFSSTLKIQQAEKVFPPAPILLLLSTDGVLCPFYLVNENPNANHAIVKAPEPVPQSGERKRSSFRQQVLQASSVAVPGRDGPSTPSGLILAKPALSAQVPAISVSSAMNSSITAGSTMVSIGPYAKFNFKTTTMPLQAKAGQPFSGSSAAFTIARTESSAGSFHIGMSTTTSTAAPSQATAGQPFNLGYSGGSSPAFTVAKTASSVGSLQLGVPTATSAAAPSQATAAQPFNLGFSGGSSPAFTVAKTASSVGSLQLGVPTTTSTAAPSQATAAQPFSLGSSSVTSSVGTGHDKPSMTSQPLLRPTQESKAAQPQLVDPSGGKQPASSSSNSLQAFVLSQQVPNRTQQSASPSKDDVDRSLTEDMFNEINHFEKELADLKKSVHEMTEHCSTMTSQEDLVGLRLQTYNIAEFCNNLQTTTEEHQKDVGESKEQLLELFEMVEEAKVRKDKNKDPQYLHLLKCRSLDPVSSNTMRDIRSCYLYLDKTLRELNLNLDEEWNKENEKKRRLQPPAMDALYRTLRDHHRTAREQAAVVSRISEQMKNRRLLASSWQKPSTSTFSNRDDDLSSLADSLLEQKLDSPTKLTQPTARVSFKKQAELRNILRNRQTLSIRRSIQAPSPDKSRVSRPKSKSSSVAPVTNEVSAQVIEEKTSPNETLRLPIYSSTPTVKDAPGIPRPPIERETSLAVQESQEDDNVLRLTQTENVVNSMREFVSGTEVSSSDSKPPKDTASFGGFKLPGQSVSAVATTSGPEVFTNPPITPPSTPPTMKPIATRIPPNKAAAFAAMNRAANVQTRPSDESTLDLGASIEPATMIIHKPLGKVSTKISSVEKSAPSAQTIADMAKQIAQEEASKAPITRPPQSSTEFTFKGAVDGGAPPVAVLKPAAEAGKSTLAPNVTVKPVSTGSVLNVSKQSSATGTEKGDSKTAPSVGFQFNIGVAAGSPFSSVAKPPLSRQQAAFPFARKEDGTPASSAQKLNETTALSFSAFSPASSDKKEAELKFPSGGLSGLPPLVLGSGGPPAVDGTPVVKGVTLSSGETDKGVSAMSSKNEEKENKVIPGTGYQEKRSSSNAENTIINSGSVTGTAMPASSTSTAVAAQQTFSTSTTTKGLFGANAGTTLFGVSSSTTTVAAPQTSATVASTDLFKAKTALFGAASSPSTSVTFSQASATSTPGTGLFVAPIKTASIGVPPSSTTLAAAAQDSSTSTASQGVFVVSRAAPSPTTFAEASTTISADASTASADASTTSAEASTTSADASTTSSEVSGIFAAPSSLMGSVPLSRPFATGQQTSSTTAVKTSLFGDIGSTSVFVATSSSMTSSATSHPASTTTASTSIFKTPSTLIAPSPKTSTAAPQASAISAVTTSFFGGLQTSTTSTESGGVSVSTGLIGKQNVVTTSAATTGFFKTLQTSATSAPSGVFGSSNTSTASSTSTGLFGTVPSSTNNASPSVFGSPASSSPFGSALSGGQSQGLFGGTQTKSSFGGMTPGPFAGSSIFGNKSSTSSGKGILGQPSQATAATSSIPTSPFGQTFSKPQESGVTMSFGGFGLGGKPQDATKNPFGAPQAGFSSLTASSGSSLFSGKTETKPAFGSGSFSSGFGSPSGGFATGSFSKTGGGVAASGFGVSNISSPTSAPAFGGSPSFGGSPGFGQAATFGVGPAFGSSPVFGGNPTFGGAQQAGTSPGRVFGGGSFGGTSGSPTFGTLAAKTELPSFGALAGQSSQGFGSVQQQPTPFGGGAAFGSTQSGGSSFGSWR